MLTLPFFRGWILFTAAGSILALSAAASAQQKPTPPAVESGRVLELAPIRIDSAQMYVPLEVGWQVAELPGFRVYSHGSATTKSITRELQVVREALGLMWGEERLLRQLVSVVVCADEPEFLRWARVSPTAFDRLARAIRTPSGLVLVLNGDNDTVHRAAGRVYVRALLEGSGLPAWLQEGLASILNASELNGDQLIVGQVKFDPRDTPTISQLQDVSMSAAFARTDLGGRAPDHTQLAGANSSLDGNLALANSRGQRMEVLVDGRLPNLGEVRRAVDQEIERRADRRVNAQGDAEFTGYLKDTTVMDLDKLLDPKAEETIRWRMNAWAFTHLAMFGEENRFRAGLVTFVGKLQASPAEPPLTFFRESFGESSGRFELRMKTYVERGKYEAIRFKLAQPFEPQAPQLEPLAESNALLLKARIYGATGRADEARAFLERGYAEPSNRTAGYVTALAGAWREADAGKAIARLETAQKSADGLDHAGRRLLAELRLEKLTAQETKLDRAALSQVLDPLFMALNGGDTTEQLFVLIGRAWQASATPPTDGQLNALRLGLRYYPESAPLGEMLRKFEHKG